jgi:secondary thiamine-phosphate synthase enzyme
MLKQASGKLTVETRGPGFTDITEPVARWLAGREIREGLLTVFVRHTSASLLIQENADPDVLADLQSFFERVAPWDGRYRHSTEGPDDMPAHIRAMLTQTSIGIPVMGGRMALGTWQGLYLVEHRARPHSRTVIVQATGE